VYSLPTRHLPAAAATVLGAFVFGFINMMTDITAVIFLVSPRWRLLSIDLFNAIDAGRLGVAAALSVIMIASTFVVLLVVWRLSGKGLDFLRRDAPTHSGSPMNPTLDLDPQSVVLERVTKRFGKTAAVDDVTSRPRPASSRPCSARRAAARPPRCASSAASTIRTRAPSTSARRS
jgi:hypothetical protein